MLHQYKLANPMNLRVKHTKPIPKIGSKIRVIDDVGFNHSELRKLCKLDDIVTTNEVMPIVIGQDGDYHWEYEVYTLEFGDDVMLLGWHYEIL